MLFKEFLLVFFSISLISCENGVTFKNVEIRAYSMFTFKFNYTIKNSNSLKETLPKSSVFDHIEIVDQNVPIIYANAFAGIDNLDELTLKNDLLTELKPGCFNSVPELRKLTIKNNRIKSIKEGVFNNVNIASLDLSNNGIVEIDSKAFDNMPELLNVMLADNNIKLWNSAWFANTPLLSRVSFQNNQIEKIPAEAFVNFKGEKQFGSVPLTINIILSHNRIDQIDRDAFKGLKKINNVWLDSNNLVDWNENQFSTEITINELRLNDNKLKCLSGDLGKIFRSEITYLDGNPWDCECLDKIDEWKRKSGKNVHMSYAIMTCSAARIEKKMRDLENYLNSLKNIEKTNEADDMLKKE